jgi:hypothetical protein
MDALVANPLGGKPLVYVLPESWGFDGTPIETALGMLSRLQGTALPSKASGQYLAGWITADTQIHNGGATQL